MGAGQTKSFVMITGVGLYGGFSWTETAREQRDWRAHTTIPSGNNGTAEDNADNSYPVVVGPIMPC